eukprot:1565669-Rhodomonas_salina.1
MRGSDDLGGFEVAGLVGEEHVVVAVAEEGLGVGGEIDQQCLAGLGLLDLVQRVRQRAQPDPRAVRCLRHQLWPHPTPSRSDPVASTSHFLSLLSRPPRLSVCLCSRPVSYTHLTLPTICSV